MPRGGKRPGAGRPPGAVASPDALNSIRAKIKTNSILQRLERFIAGEIAMEPAAVTAALGLLRKVMPDLAAVQHSGELVTKRASDVSDDELAHIAGTSSERVAETPVDPTKLN